MSAKNSNLASRGFDLVAAVTQAAVNVTMKIYLSQYDGDEFIMCYVAQKNQDGQYDNVPIDINNLGVDPFSIPNNDSGNPGVQTLYAQKFTFAFKVQMGLPSSDHVAKTTLPSILELNQGLQNVSYNLYCKTFQIVSLTNNFGDITWTNISQFDNGNTKPWVFNFKVNMAMGSNDNAFASLPQSVKDTVKNLNPNSIFGVEQLYLNLNNVFLAASPEITGLDKSSDAYFFLTKVFINTYFVNLKNKNTSDTNPNGYIILGYAIKPKKNPISEKSSLVLTDLNYLVSPFLDKNGYKTEEYDLYTLNYLTMIDGNIMPDIKAPFEWNWVDKIELQGIISVQKKNFASYLQKQFSTQLSSICFVPSVSFSINLIEATIGVSCQKATEQQYRIVNDGNKVLSFHIEKEAKDDDFFFPNWGNIQVKCSTSSDVYFDGDKIKISSEIKSFIHLNILGGITEGDFVKFRLDVDYLLYVDAFGQLSVKKGDDNYQNLSDDIDANGWSQFVSLGQAEDVVKKIASYYASFANYLTTYADVLTNELLGAKAWTYPGSCTFLFKNAQFSDSLDLVSEVTYVEPSYERLNNLMTEELFQKEKGLPAAY